MVSRHVPDDTQVFERALALCAHYLRSRIEGGLKYSDDESKKKWRAYEKFVRAWSKKESVARSPAEKKLWQKPLGSWSEQAIVNGNWRLETLGVCVWAVSLTPSLPSYDRPFPRKIIANLGAPAFDLTSEPVDGFRKRAKLRSDAVLERKRDCAELWHWRAVTARQPSTPRKRAIIADAAKLAHQNGDLGAPIARDFPLFGKSYAKLSERERDVASSISIERHYALEWLTGEGEEAWDDVRTDT